MGRRRSSPAIRARRVADAGVVEEVVAVLGGVLPAAVKASQCFLKFAVDGGES